MKRVGILLFWSVLLPSLGVWDQAADSEKALQTVTSASMQAHGPRLRRSDGRHPQEARDRAGLGRALWDGEDDDDSDGCCIAFEAPLTSAHVVGDAPWSLFSLSQTKAVWTSCHRIPLRC